MLNKLLLLGYGAMFIALVSSYDNYKDNTLLVAGAGAMITILGLAAWIFSIRGKR